MTYFDRLLQNWRIHKAAPFIQPGDRVLDLGSVDGVLFDRLGYCGPGSMGIDPTLSSNQITRQGFRLISGYYPWEMPDNVSFDVIVLLAVIEHFPPDQYVSVAQGCVQHLRPGGKLIITVPGPKVDPILFVLVKLGIVHGMSLEEHHGFQPGDTPKIFAEPDFRLIEARRFQLGLNHLFVFERS